MENYNGRIFRISNSKDIYVDWRGKSFNELTLDDQRKLKNKTIHAIIVEQLQPENYDGLFLIFERINSGGVQLNQQEIRNAIFQNKYSEMLVELNNDDLWREMFGDKKPHKRMKDIEMILRFFALNSYTVEQNDMGSISFVELLNNQMKENISITEEQSIFEKDKFLNTLRIVKSNFGCDIFRRNPSERNKTTKKFFATLFDAIMVATAYALQKGHNSYSTLDKVETLLSNELFKTFINSHTTDNKAIYGRIDLACKILYGIDYVR